ncbi:GNAT family N-acetyltransferase [Consotaella aegiceratis]|uniref:GNAT family N-acetyltransferase n=1 Tax=Consotaella aegiceratis TaxID=3097961 RepID=UPI002F3E76BB
MHDYRWTADTGDLVIRVADNCADLEETWRRLQAVSACTAFQTFEWVSALLETVGRVQGVEPRIVLVGDGSGRPLMLLPFALRKTRGLHLLEFIDFKVSDYNAPIIRREFARTLTAQTFERLWHQILAAVGAVDAVRFEKMPAKIDDVPNPMSFLSCVQEEQSHYARLDGTYEKYLAGRSTNARQGTLRKRRKLAKQGGLTFLHATNGQDADRLVEAMIRQKSRRYRSTGVADLFDDRSYADFYRTIAQRDFGGLIHVSGLMLDDRPVGTVFGTEFRGRLCLLMPTFDADFSYFSPGRMLILDLIHWCYAQKISVLDFTWGDEEYKCGWTNDSLPLYTHCRGLTWRGHFWARSTRAKVVGYRFAKRQLQRSGPLFAAAKKLRTLIRSLQRHGRPDTLPSWESAGARVRPLTDSAPDNAAVRTDDG